MTKDQARLQLFLDLLYFFHHHHHRINLRSNFHLWQWINKSIIYRQTRPMKCSLSPMINMPGKILISRDTWTEMSYCRKKKKTTVIEFHWSSTKIEHHITNCSQSSWERFFFRREHLLAVAFTAICKHGSITNQRPLHLSFKALLINQ